MHLVGASKIIKATATDGDAVAWFYGGLIPRLLKEVDRGDRLSRLVGFRAMLDQGALWQFLGVDVGHLDKIPAGMTGLTLGDSFGEVTGQAAGPEHFSLEWLWRDAAGPADVGEFRAAFPAETAGSRLFSMTVNAYVGAETSLSEDDAIELVDYDSSWPDQFAEMAGWLRGVLPAGATRVAHYGSTSVPGMPAKPVIDILVEAPSFEEARRCIVPRLNCELWEYWWYVDHMIFIKRQRLNGPRTHHVHIAPWGHRLWEGLAFRDYLIAHHEAACGH
jgi:GrpB-like predicted nucleotidyltransferase (UPF0157 family)